MNTMKFNEIALLAAAFFALGLPQAEASLVTNTSTAVVYCTGAGQLCNNAYDVTVLTTNTMSGQARFYRLRSECSP
jgi:hypothetical protein